MKIYIFNSGYLDLKGEKRSFGGVDTYIYLLANTIKEMNIEPIIYQYADEHFYVNQNEVSIVGVKINQKWSLKRKNTVVIKEIYKVFNNNEDILIFATDYLNVKNKFKRTISIQHGVAWDIKNNEGCSLFINKLNIIKAAIRAFVKVDRYSHVNKLVCVDYNFLNWYRTQLAYIPNDIYVIPNCADSEIPIKKEHNNKVKIIFARRLCEYRGTKIFTKAIIRILNKYENIEVTIAGDGPDKKFMEEKLGVYKNVKFIKYNAEESIPIHMKHDIAVVPTIGSEGTSLSLLEAMVSECAVIATNVGGMTNIIINRYNGLMVDTNENELYTAIEQLILDEQLRKFLAAKGREVVKCSFSLDIWKKEWRKVIEDTIKEVR